CGRFGARQVDAKRSSPPWLAFDLDMTATLLHDAIAGRQPQPGSLADLLGGKERFEKMGLDLGGHADPSIGNGQHHIVPGPSFGTLISISIAQSNIICLNN